MKFGPFFIVTIASGALFGWFAPDFAQSGPSEPAAGGGDRLETSRQQWHAGEVVLSRAGDGHFYAQATIGSGSVMMLVDSGATVIALTGNDAAMMGVDWNERDVRPVARGASGDVYGVPVMLDSVQVGEIEARRVRAVVVPEGLDVSLLGQSFMATVNRVEVNGDEMVLHD